MSARHLLRDNVIERDFGVRAAINLTLVGADDPLTAESRVRSIDFKQVAGVTTRTRRQTSRDIALDNFELDRSRDILRKITTHPIDKEAWGIRVTGGDSFTAGLDINFDGIADFCARLDAIATDTTFQQRYPWINQLRAIRDKTMLANLHEQIVGALLDTEMVTAFELSPPEIVDWDRVSQFQFHYDRRAKVRRPTFELHHYLAGLNADDELTYEKLRNRNVFAIDSDGYDVHKWSVWRCLTGTLELDGHTYVIDDGEIFQVSKDLLAELDLTIDSIPVANLALPSCMSGTVEGVYNEETANAHPDLILLDKKFVKPGPNESQIEVCDLFSKQRHLVHVKRDFSSSTLSHLFNQGLVVAESLVKQAYMRDRVAELLANAGSPEHQGLISIDAFHTTEFEIVYAIIGRWNAKNLQQLLPFFSKLTLRHVVNSLRSMGYRVSYIAVEQQTF